MTANVTYSLAEIRNGTGFARGARFILLEPGKCAHCGGEIEAHTISLRVCDACSNDPLIEAQYEEVENELLEAAKAAVPLLIRLGDFIGNGEIARPYGGNSPIWLGTYDRCAVILRLRNAVDQAEAQKADANAESKDRATLVLQAICPDCGEPVAEAGWTCGKCGDDDDG